MGLVLREAGKGRFMSLTELHVEMQPHFETSYGRGLTQTEIVKQKMSGQTFHTQVNLEVYKDKLQFFFGLNKGFKK